MSFSLLGYKLNKIWVDQGIDFFIRSMNAWLHDNDIDIYSTHSKGKSIVAERSMRTQKTNIYKNLPTVSKNIYIDRLDEIVDKFNKTDHKAINADFKLGNYVDYGL